MMIEMQVDDLPRLREMGRSFFREGRLPGRFNPESFERMWGVMMEAGASAVFAIEADGDVAGALGATLFPDPASGQLTASELFWYVMPAHRSNPRIGMRLLKAFEAWGKKNGAQRLMMAHELTLMPRRLSEFYKRMGYRAQEVHYLKEVAL